MLHENQISRLPPVAQRLPTGNARERRACSRELHPKQNHLLAALSPEVQRRLFPHLQLVKLRMREFPYQSLCPVNHVYFPIDSKIALQALLEDGSMSALAVVGNEGLLGIHLCLADGCTPSQAMVQNAGYAYRLPKNYLKDELKRSGELLVLILRYTQALLTQVGQTAVCSRYHTIDQQLCRWLLLSSDGLPHNRLTMTQDLIGNLLGVRREGITEAASKLRDLGVISYSRGRITVIDRPQLELHSCECYRAVASPTLGAPRHQAT